MKVALSAFWYAPTELICFSVSSSALASWRDWYEQIIFVIIIYPMNYSVKHNHYQKSLRLNINIYTKFDNNQISLEILAKRTLFASCMIVFKANIIVYSWYLANWVSL